MQNTLGEIPVFLGAVYGGAVIGILYGMFRAAELVFRARWTSCALDACFYILAGIAAALTMLKINGGVPRMYVFAGLGLGAFLSAFGIGGLLHALVFAFFRCSTRANKK